MDGIILRLGLPVQTNSVLTFLSSPVIDVFIYFSWCHTINRIDSPLKILAYTAANIHGQLITEGDQKQATTFEWLNGYLRR
jgi:hypothetical protein